MQQLLLLVNVINFIDHKEINKQNFLRLDNLHLDSDKFRNLTNKPFMLII